MAYFMRINDSQLRDFNKTYVKYIIDHSDGTCIQYPASHGPDVNNEQTMVLEFGKNHYKEFCKALKENGIYYMENEG